MHHEISRHDNGTLMPVAVPEGTSLMHAAVSDALDSIIADLGKNTPHQVARQD
jgi:hypothetical protein